MISESDTRECGQTDTRCKPLVISESDTRECRQTDTRCKPLVISESDPLQGGLVLVDLCKYKRDNVATDRCLWCLVAPFGTIENVCGVVSRTHVLNG